VKQLPGAGCWLINGQYLTFKYKTKNALPSPPGSGAAQLNRGSFGG